MREAGRRGEKIPQVPLLGGRQGDAVTHHILTYKHRYLLLELIFRIVGRNVCTSS